MYTRSSMRLAPEVSPSPLWFFFLSRTCLLPEKMLMLAVLKDAFCAFEKYLPRQNEKFRREEEWFLYEKSDRLFSFQNICDVLQMDANAIRENLRRRIKQAACLSDTVALYNERAPAPLARNGTLAAAATTPLRKQQKDRRDQRGRISPGKPRPDLRVLG